MLNQDDIKEINHAVEKSLLPKIAVEVGKVIEHNITPAIDGLTSQINKVDTKLENIETRLDRVESQMVTKSYLDDKLIAWEGR